DLYGNGGALFCHHVSLRNCGKRPSPPAHAPLIRGGGVVISVALRCLERELAVPSQRSSHNILRQRHCNEWRTCRRVALGFGQVVAGKDITAPCVLVHRNLPHDTLPRAADVDLFCTAPPWGA